MKSKFEFNSHGDALIKGYHYYDGTKEPKGILVISHGMAEHILRYENFSEFLVMNGVFVYGYSHRGHFETAGTVEAQGYLGADGWSKMLDDLGEVIQIAHGEYSETPIWLLGHSMGSYLGREYIQFKKNDLAGIILSGTGYPSKMSLKAGEVLAKLEEKLKGDQPSKALDAMSFGSFNKAFKPTKTNFDWLSRDEKQVQLYVDSPWCGHIHPSSFFSDMAKHMIQTLYTEMLPLQRSQPMLVMSGVRDPVGQFGKGVKKTADYYRRAGFDVTLKLYEDGRHEMLNEINRNEVYQDILNFIVK